MSEEPAMAPGVPEWDIADRLRKALRYAGIGVQEMADYLGVNRNTVSNWINGRIEPSFQTLRLWSIRCDVDLEWLLDRQTATLTPVTGSLSRSTNLSWLITRSDKELAA